MVEIGDRICAISPWPGQGYAVLRYLGRGEAMVIESQSKVFARLDAVWHLPMDAIGPATGDIATGAHCKWEFHDSGF